MKSIDEFLALGQPAIEDFAEDLAADIAALLRDLESTRLSLLFSRDEDSNDCFLELHAGAGGTEAQDWCAMLSRMYMRCAEQTGYDVSVIDEQPGEEAGLKSIVLRITKPQNVSAQHGPQVTYPYGWFAGEMGVHRLVRVSPFDSQKRRHTSFAAVSVYPELDDKVNIVIEEKDLKVDTYRASGAGGQHVNKTDSAVRITHMPTGIVVQCQSDRSQHRNRAQALKMLQGRLYEVEMQKKQQAIDVKNAQKTDIGWGHQVRSYVLHPYRMVKDQRTGVETSQTDDVLNGSLDMFLEAQLVARSLQRPS